jgi:serine/threonine-protein kinase
MELPDYVGRFRVLDLVGEGAMGVVFRGRDESLDRDVALKLMRAPSADADDTERFLREARSVARLQHPNIITVYELGQHNGAPFIAMELLEGVDLQRAIEGGLRPNPRVTLPIVMQLLAGLGHAHEHGIVHRDIKPSNLFLPRGRPAKIMDFGVARLGGSTSAAGLIVGTPNYMSPEQVQAQPVDGRSDLFSAGLILYELVTGERAYQGASVVALVYQIAHEDPDLGLIPRGPQWERLRDVLVRALAKDPDQRYDTAERMAGDLAAALQELGGSIDGAAASDKGLVKRDSGPPAMSAFAAARTAPAAPAAAGRPTGAGPGELAAPVEEAEPEHRLEAPREQRPRWLVPAIAGVIVLVGAAAALVAALLWPHADDRRPDTARTAEPTPSASAESLVSAAAALRSSATAKGTASTARPATPAGVRPSVPAPRTEAPPAEGSASSRATVVNPRPPRRGDPPATAGAPTPSAGRLDRAGDLYESGHYAAALAEARAVLRREPGNAQAKALVEDIEVDMVVEQRLKQAREALRRGDREAALAQVRAGLAVKSTDARLMSLFRELTR